MHRFMIFIMVAAISIGCGAPPRMPIRSPSPSKPATDVADPIPVIPDDKAPLRLVPTPVEIRAASEAYTANCSICHGTVELSTKRKVTLARLSGGGVVTAVPLHTDVLSAKKWPVDVPDIIDDGKDTAALMASALVEVMK